MKPFNKKRLEGVSVEIKRVMDFLEDLLTGPYDSLQEMEAHEIDRVVWERLGDLKAAGTLIDEVVESELEETQR